MVTIPHQPELLLPGMSSISSQIIFKLRKPTKDLYVYSLRFYSPHPREANKNIEYNKKKEIGGAFEALLKSGHLGLDTQALTWATDFKTLWTSNEKKSRTPITDPDLGHIERASWTIVKKDVGRVDGNGFLDYVENGVPKLVGIKLTHLGAKPEGPGQIKVLSNYINVTKIPDRIFVYSMKIWRPYPKKAGSIIEYIKRMEIIRAYPKMKNSFHRVLPNAFY